MRRDTRNFITVVATMPEHPKAEGLSDAAFRALIEAWCWCFRQENDGHMSAESWQRRGSAKVRAELLRERWVDVLDDGTYQMHDYTEHQQSRADREALSKARAEAGRRGGQAKARAKQQTGNGVASASGLVSKSVPEQNRTEQIPSAGGSVDLQLGGRDDENRRLAQDLVNQHRAALKARRAPDLMPSIAAALVAKTAACLAEGATPAELRQAMPMLDERHLGPGALALMVRDIQLGPRRPPSGAGRFDPQAAMADALAMEQQEVSP